MDVNQVQEHRTDEELLRKYCAKGELVYLVEVYKRYMPLVYGVALKYLKRPEDAQDAVMQLFDSESKRERYQNIQAMALYLRTKLLSDGTSEADKKFIGFFRRFFYGILR